MNKLTLLQIEIDNLTQNNDFLRKENIKLNKTKPRSSRREIYYDLDNQKLIQDLSLKLILCRLEISRLKKKSLLYFSI